MGWYFIPILIFEILGSYGIGAYGKTAAIKWMLLTFVSFGLTGAILGQLAHGGKSLGWLSLFVFGCYAYGRIGSRRCGLERKNRDYRNCRYNIDHFCYGNFKRSSCLNLILNNYEKYA